MLRTPGLSAIASDAPLSSVTISALGTAAMLGAGNAAILKLAADYFPHETGSAIGLIGAAGGLGGFFPPLVLGYIRGQSGPYGLGFIFLSGFAVVCFVVNHLIFLRKGRDQAAVAVVS
jgi:NNP family nitrate/nitrite transporter-like MFS transporter